MFTVERPLDDGGVDEEAAVVEGDRDGESAVVAQEVIPSAVQCSGAGCTSFDRKSNRTVDSKAQNIESAELYLSTSTPVILLEMIS